MLSVLLAPVPLVLQVALVVFEEQSLLALSLRQLQVLLERSVVVIEQVPFLRMLALPAVFPVHIA